jgi:diguanylate cyclase (GGDEF)-like protein
MSNQKHKSTKSEVSPEDLSSVKNDSALPQFFDAEQALFDIEENDLSTDKQQLELALWAANQSFWTWDRESTLVTVKVYLDGYFNVVEKSARFDSFLKYIHKKDLSVFTGAWDAHVEGSSSELCVRFRYLVDNVYIWYELKGKINAFDDNGAQSIIGTFADINHIVNSQTKLVLMSEAFEQASQPMLVLDKNMTILECNDAWKSQVSAPSKTKAGNLAANEKALTKSESSDFTSLVDVSEDSRIALEKHGFSHSESVLRLSDERNIPIELSLSFFSSTDSMSVHYIALIKDLSERLKTEAELVRLATRDPVTNLINRRELETRLDVMIREENTSFDLYYIDLVGVKEVSDALGHQNSDNLLIDIANKMTSLLADANLIARWGSNEFIMVQDCSTYAKVDEIIVEINDIISSSTFMRNGQKFTISCYVGVSRFPDHAQTAYDLIRRADAALHYSKEATKANFSFYSAGMAEEIENKIRLVNDLRQALEADELNFVLQGKYDQQRTLVGAELLCRWKSEKHGFVSPDVFIPLIETYGMEYALGISALSNAINYIHKLAKLDIYIPISVNISASQILDASFYETLQMMLVEAKIDPKLIELEVTESVFINNGSDANSSLNNLKKLGVLISLDDFGTGYSSLSYLGQYDFDQVKIDRAFIMEIEQDTKAQKLFDAIMNICRALDLDVVVEGVETEKQFSILNSAGVSKFQGYLLGRPIDIIDFIEQNHLH